jgi:type IV pilus assembly protein PilW
MKRSRGFTLVELMIAMVLGLVIVGSVMAVMLANKRSYRTNEGLSQVQESARTAFELLAHDLRQADGNGCTTSTRTTNVLTPRTAWWHDWFGMAGYDQTEADPAVAIGTADGERVAGTDSIAMQSMDGAGLAVALHDPVAYRVDVATPHDFSAGDIILLCDFDHAAIFRATAVTGTTSVFHNNFVGTPGNCKRGLGFPHDCATTVGDGYQFPQNAQIGRLFAVDWYIGNNGRPGEGGRSLYRRRLILGAGGIPVTDPEEIVAGITDMQMQFRATGSNAIITDASLVPDWSVISSVLIQITALSSDTNVTTDPTVNAGRVQRQFNYLISLRNRLP